MGSSEGGKKVAAKLKAKNPNYYRELAEKSKIKRAELKAQGLDKPTGFAYLKANNPDKLKAVASKGGKRSKRK